MLILHQKHYLPFRNTHKRRRRGGGAGGCSPPSWKNSLFIQQDAMGKTNTTGGVGICGGGVPKKMKIA